MQDAFYIRQVAILGAGVMGAQIAAHCVNAGFKTLLFDLPAVKGPRNALVEKSIAQMAKINPAPLAYPDLVKQIDACNYDEHLTRLADCDLVIEAIAERMDLKEALYERIIPFLGKETILASNTSGLSINELATKLPYDMRSRFCGVHFFNPPRYMHLAELIPANTTNPVLLDKLETWLTSMLGKGVIRAKDTPNFIANRIGVFSLLSTLYFAEQHGLTPDEVDALTGLLIGRPKSATYRTLDVVGLDTMLHVVNTMKEQLETDPWHGYFKMPTWLMRLIEQGHLGQKTGQGVYRKNAGQIEVFNPYTGAYQLAQAEVNPEVKLIMACKDVKERMQRLYSSTDPQAHFLKDCFINLYHYCAYHLIEIADNVRDIDNAMTWGFGWRDGPFHTWQLAGFRATLDVLRLGLTSKKMMADTAALPAWLSNIQGFYQDEAAYAPVRGVYQKTRGLAVYHRQQVAALSPIKSNAKQHVLYENSGVILSHLQDDIAVLSFKSKANTINHAVVEGIKASLHIANLRCLGLIIYQDDASNFSFGADLRAVTQMLDERNLNSIERLVIDFQEVLLAIKYSSIPVVAALRGRALGGGCELLLHCSRVVASFESYVGLVELGAGLIPAGGGCKEMALRAAQMSQGHDLMSYLLPYYQQITKAEVSLSATDAKRRGYLKATDIYLMHSEEILFAAIAQVHALKDSNYKPPIESLFPVAGSNGIARLQTGLVNWLEGGFISQYDYHLALELAKVICGGPVDAGTLVSEQWMLKLERETFMRLLTSAETEARMRHLVETGKPLRN